MIPLSTVKPLSIICKQGIIKDGFVQNNNLVSISRKKTYNELGLASGNAQTVGYSYND